MKQPTSISIKNLMKSKEQKSRFEQYLRNSELKDARLDDSKKNRPPTNKMLEESNFILTTS